jgi:hypothetical protein
VTVPQYQPVSTVARDGLPCFVLFNFPHIKIQFPSLYLPLRPNSSCIILRGILISASLSQLYLILAQHARPFCNHDARHPRPHHDRVRCYHSFCRCGMRCCRPVEHLCTRLPWILQAGNWLCVVRLSLAARSRRRISGESIVTQIAKSHSS